VLDAAGNVINVLSDPVTNLVLHPLAVAGGAAYDAAAHTFGFRPMTSEQRADLYGLPQPGQSQLPPEQQQPGTRLIGSIDQTIPGQTAASLPASPTEQVVRGLSGAGATAAMLAPGAVAPIAAMVGSATGDVASRYVPDWAKPGAELAGNVAGAGATGGVTSMLRTPVGLVDSGKAALARTAIEKYDIPLEASDLTTDPRFQRTGPASVQATANKQDAWQRAYINEMGADGSKFMPGPSGPMATTAARTGQVYDNIAARTDINKANTDSLVHNDLAAIEANLDNVAGITDSDRAVVRRRLGEIVDAVQSNGTITGADYRALTKTNSPLERLTNNSNSELANIGNNITDALTDAFTKSASPADQAALATNNHQYRAMKTVQDLAAKSPDGNINPGDLMAKVVTASRRFDPSTGGMAYTGGGNIGELARIGAMMDISPNFAPKGDLSGKLLKIGEGVGGAVAAGHFIDPSLLAAGAVVPAGMALNAARAAYLRSDFGRNALLRNALSEPPSSYAGVLPAISLNQLLR